MRGAAFILIGLVFAPCVVASESFELPRNYPDPYVKKAFEKQWGDRYESTAYRAVMVLPRLLGRVIAYPFHSETGYRLFNLGEGIYYAAISSGEKEALLKAGHRFFSESPLNLLGTVESLFSDLVGLLKLPLHVDVSYTPRIQFCTVNLVDTSVFRGGLLGFVASTQNPMRHVGFVIDGENETKDAKRSNLLDDKNLGGMMCVPVPLVGNESASLAIERLRCVDSAYESEYHFLDNNCVSYSADVASLSGLALPKLPNAGIGGILRKKAVDADVRATEESCDDQILRIRNGLFSLEKGESLTWLERRTIDYALNPDMVVQAVVSAARSRSVVARKSLSTMSFSLKALESYFNEEGKVRRIFKDDLNRIFMGLDQRDYDWIERSRYSRVAELYRRLYGGSPQERYRFHYEDFDPFEKKFLEKGEIRELRVIDVRQERVRTGIRTEQDRRCPLNDRSRDCFRVVDLTEPSIRVMVAYRVAGRISDLDRLVRKSFFFLPEEVPTRFLKRRNWKSIQLEHHDELLTVAFPDEV